ncbi:MAG: DUF393 domain-containing protein [Pseudomonadota bacterium]
MTRLTAPITDQSAYREDALEIMELAGDGDSRQNGDHGACQKLTVFYDGGCPICKKEIELYRKIDPQKSLIWQDITSLKQHQIPTGKSRKQLLEIFHVNGSNGEWHTGVDAFGVIWSRLPALRRFSFVFSFPVTRHLAIGFYQLFLAWQRIDRKRRKNTSGSW